MESNELGTGRSPSFVELRRCPRFPLDVEITIQSHSCGVLRGRTVDISESGIAAIVKIEVPLNEIVQLEFTLPEGAVEVGALVRQRIAFRYGLQFVEGGPARELIAETCWRLSRKQSQ